MDARHRDMIHGNLETLLEKTENIELLIDELVVKGTITESIAHEIRKSNDPIVRTEHLYLRLTKCGPNAFKSLLEAFHDTGNEDVALILKDNRLCNQSPIEGRSPSDDSDEESLYKNYRMKSNPRGMVLIINVFQYEDDYRTKRLGSEKDVENLTNLFEDMGFKVQTPKVDSGKKRDIEESIIWWKSQTELSGVDCGIIIFMSHGTEGKPDSGTVWIDTSDKKKIESEWIINQMSSSEAYRLIGKPKLIFILTCRGDRMDGGLDEKKLYEFINALDESPQGSFNGNHQYDGAHMQSRTSTVASPMLSDVLLIYPCAPGRASSRDEELGSWFVQAMCDVFRKKAHKDDVETMLKEMDRKLLRKSRSMDGWYSFQVICTTSRGFMKKLFLNPIPSFTNGNAS